jgi:hypothetical protein
MTLSRPRERDVPHRQALVVSRTFLERGYELTVNFFYSIRRAEGDQIVTISPSPEPWLNFFISLCERVSKRAHVRLTIFVCTIWGGSKQVIFR